MQARVVLQLLELSMWARSPPPHQKQPPHSPVRPEPAHKQPDTHPGAEDFYLAVHALSKALGVLIRKGHLKHLEPHPLPNNLPSTHNPAKYCAFHQQQSHETDQCFRLHHEIQDLIDNKVIAPPEKPNVTTNPLPPHNQAPPPKHINLIQTVAIPYDPSVYITPSHLPKPKVFIPEIIDLCMVGISQTQPEPVVVTVEDRTGLTLEEDRNVDSEPEGSGSFTEEAYNPCGYIVSTDQVKLRVELPAGAEISVVWEDGPGQQLDDLAELEEDIANLQFFEEHDLGDVNIN
ncbi:hypothetical protein HYC85_028938 [Camellia sinensis]|uniref:Uncharacterized protein n=1 Tax=Camellia sinensis TaxID=4442 RepID=A0A7J7FX96_CAMSI|nr:hypothetical protein HYC85_028938 [Camellia sinensis]